MSDNNQNQQEPNELKSKLLFAIVAGLIMLIAKLALG